MGDSTETQGTAYKEKQEVGEENMMWQRREKIQTEALGLTGGMGPHRPEGRRSSAVTRALTSCVTLIKLLNLNHITQRAVLRIK